MYRKKKSKESSPLYIVFAHAEENRHALVYEYVYTLFFITIMLIAVGVQHLKKKKKEKKKPRENSP
jgi:hypothetical protein